MDQLNRLRRGRIMTAVAFAVMLGQAVAAVTVAAAEVVVLDAFTYDSLEAARSQWRAAEGTPPVRIEPLNGRDAMRIDVPFAQEDAPPRVVLDRTVKLDLASYGEFSLVLSCDRPEAISQVTVYFHSPGGWYGASHDLKNGLIQSLRFSKASFQTEQTPAGWDQIDGIRIAAWRGAAIDTSLGLLQLSAHRNPVAVLMPSVPEAAASGECRHGRELAENQIEWLADCGVDVDPIDTEQLTDTALAGRSVVVVPYHPKLPPGVEDRLIRFTESGGKVVLFYQTPLKLLRAIGLTEPKYLRPDPQGQFSSMRKQALAADWLATRMKPPVPAGSLYLQGVPDVALQRSWNIILAQPTDHGATPIAQWHDADGKPTGLPAVCVSERGAFFSHVLLPGDDENKRQLLLAVLGWLDREVWTIAARREIENMYRIGPFSTREEVIDSFRGKPTFRLYADYQYRRAEESLPQGRPVQTIELARAARQQVSEWYIMVHPSKPIEARGFWDHSGLGCYPGDWERTAVELQKAGVNMILPNMLWAGRAHYPSDVLPRSTTFTEYGDQIAACVAASHRHGIEVHVWKVNFNLLGAPKEFVERMRREGRLQIARGGESQPWLCPSHPDNVRLEVDSMVEVARKYDVDGIHFDYIRYPSSLYCFCDGCRSRFEAELGQSVANWPDDCATGDLADRWRAWRRERINTIVRLTAEGARKVRPDIKLSAAVFGDHRSSRETIGQDWAAWAKAGWIDFVCPMDYTESDSRFETLVRSQVELADGTIPVYAGIGATASRSHLSPDRVVGQIIASRNCGADGYIIFALRSDSPQRILPALGRGVGSAPADRPHEEMP